MGCTPGRAPAPPHDAEAVAPTAAAADGSDAMTLVVERDVVDAELDGIPGDDENAAAFLARLRVATVTGRLPHDVGRWAVDVIADHLPAAARRMARDRCLRTAANMLSGSAWAKARRLEREILAARGLRSRRARVRPREATVAAHVRQALMIDPETPTSMRHLLRVVTGG